MKLHWREAVYAICIVLLRHVYRIAQPHKPPPYDNTIAEQARQIMREIDEELRKR